MSEGTASPPTRSAASLWRSDDAAKPTLLAVGYVAAAYALGLAGLTARGWLPFLLGIALVAHSLVVSAYLIHDCAHLLVFRRRIDNFRLGEVLSWLCGAAYARFPRIHRMHLRHHADRADVACFDLRGFLLSAPAWLRQLVLALEWLHLPAAELVMHAQVIVRPFTDEAVRSERARVLVVAGTKVAFFTILGLVSAWALVGHALAYLLFVKALFLADAFAHTYPFFIVAREEEPVPRDGRNAHYDTLHTYSNVVSDRSPLLNLFNLNFGYHNAHHDRPAEPWYRLPQVHRDLYPADSPQWMPYREVWRSFHRNRGRCVLADDPGEIGEGPGRVDDFLAVHGVSFLTIV